MGINVFVASGTLKMPMIGIDIDEMKEKFRKISFIFMKI